jgi:hypothetical protein
MDEPTGFLLIRAAVYGHCDHFRFCDRHGIQRSSSPSYLKRQSLKIDNTAVATVTAQVMRPPHKNAIDRTRLNAQRAKHTFGIIDRKSSDLEPLAVLDPLFADVNAVHRARLRTLITRDARREVITVETTISSRNGHGFLWINEFIRERPAVGFIRDQPVSQCDPHPVRYGNDRRFNISEPSQHTSDPASRGS